MATMTIRCDEADKKAAQEVAEYYGFDLSSVTRAFWKQMGRTHSIPLDLGNGEPNSESVSALDEGDAFLASGKPGRFDSADTLLKAALE